MTAPPAASPARGAPSISIVLPTLDRPGPLREALDSLLLQQTDNSFTYEVLVVDNAGAEAYETRRVVLEVAAGAAVPVRYLHQPLPGVAHARNCGVSASASDWVAFFDDDQVADPRWLTNLLAAAVALKAVCVGGAICLQVPPDAGMLSPMSRRLLGEQPFTGGPRLCLGPDIPSSGNLMVARHLFRTIDAFDVVMNAGGEDTELVRRIRRLGRRVIVAPAAMVHHAVPVHRTSRTYVGWVASRAGSQLAYTDRKHFGAVWLLVLCAARLVHAAFWSVPLGVIAWACGSHMAVIDARLRLRRMRGYLRQSRMLFEQGGPAAFDVALDMRTERTAPTLSGTGVL